jgi:hypothetical protein
MMRIDKYTRREKYLRELDTKHTTHSRYMGEYVDLEQPRFAGWNISITLDTKHLDDLLIDRFTRILEFLGLDKPIFIRKVATVKIIRRLNHNFRKFLNTVLEKNSYSTTYGFSLIHASEHDIKREIKSTDSWRCISRKKFNRTPEDLKKYFYRMLNYYWLNEKSFPNNILKIKVSKAYHTKVFIPDGEGIADYERCMEILRNSGYWGQYRSSWDIKPKIRDKWKRALNTLKQSKTYEDYWWCDMEEPGFQHRWIDEWNYGGIPPVSFSELEEETLRQFKLFKHK